MDCGDDGYWQQETICPRTLRTLLVPMLQASSSGQSIEMRRSADYLGVLGRSMSGQNPLPAVAKQATEGIADVRATHRLDVHPNVFTR